MVIAERPLRRRRRRRRGRGRLRGAAGDRRSAQVDGRGRGDDPRGHRRQGRGRPRQAHPSEPHLHLGGGRQGGDRRRVRQCPGDGQGGDPQPARASVPARDLRLRRFVRQGHGPAHRLHDLAGAAPGAHGGRDAVRHPGKQDPHHRRRHRRRLRQQGADLPRLRRARSSPRSSPACRSSGSSRASTTSRPPASPATTTAPASSPPTPTAASRRCASPRSPTTAPSTRTSRRPSSRRACSRICTGSYDIPKAYCRVDAVYTNKAPGGVAYRCSLRVTEAVYLIERMIDVLAQKLGIDKAEIRRRNFVKGAVPLHDRARLDDRQRRLPRRAREGAEGGRLRRPAPGAGARSAPKRRADGHRRRHLHRDRRRRPDQGLRHPRHRPVRQLRDPRPSDRQRDRAPGHDEPGPGPRDHLRADHRHRARPAVRRHPGRGGRHRQGALRRRHLGLALDAGGRRRGRDGGAQDPGEGAEDRRPPARGGRGRPRMGDRPLQGQGQPGAGQDDEGDRHGGAHQQPAGRHGARAWTRSSTTTRRT